jgi:hypothetical protein
MPLERRKAFQIIVRAVGNDTSSLSDVDQILFAQLFRTLHVQQKEIGIYQKGDEMLVIPPLRTEPSERSQSLPGH